MLGLIPITFHVGLLHVFGRPDHDGVSKLHKSAEALEGRACEIVGVGLSAVVFQPLVRSIDDARRKAETVHVGRACVLGFLVTPILNAFVGDFCGFGFVVAHAAQRHRQRHDFATGWKDLVLIDVFDMGRVIGLALYEFHLPLFFGVVTSHLEPVEHLGPVGPHPRSQLIGMLFVGLSLRELDLRGLRGNRRPYRFEYRLPLPRQIVVVPRDRLQECFGSGSFRGLIRAFGIVLARRCPKHLAVLVYGDLVRHS